MKLLFILNDAPYGSERCYNGLRLAGAAAKREGNRVRVFLMGDAVGCAKSGQSVPQGWYNVNRMLRAVALNSGEIGVCGSCMEARGLGDADLVEGVRRGSLDQLTDWTLWADQVVTF